MQWSTWVSATNETRECIVIRAVSRFVAQTPQNYRWMNSVAPHHSRATLNERRQVSRVVTDTRIKRVAFDIGFIYDIHSKFIAEIVKNFVVRIVRTPNRRDVVASHHCQIAPNVGNINGAAIIGMMIVSVHAKNPNWLAIHEQLSVLDFDTPKASF